MIYKSKSCRNGEHDCTAALCMCECHDSDALDSENEQDEQNPYGFGELKDERSYE